MDSKNNFTGASENDLPAAKHFTEEQLLEISESMLAAGKAEGKDYFVAGTGEAIEMDRGIYIKNAWGQEW